MDQITHPNNLCSVLLYEDFSKSGVVYLPIREQTVLQGPGSKRHQVLNL